MTRQSDRKRARLIVQLLLCAAAIGGLVTLGNVLSAKPGCQCPRCCCKPQEGGG